MIVNLVLGIAYSVVAIAYLAGKHSSYIRLSRIAFPKSLIWVGYALLTLIQVIDFLGHSHEVRPGLSLQQLLP